jgi:D-alanyl-D-alanine carboxypeptidase (penicillin-binding protein 5/6)
LIFAALVYITVFVLLFHVANQLFQMAKQAIKQDDKRQFQSLVSNGVFNGNTEQTAVIDSQRGQEESRPSGSPGSSGSSGFGGDAGQTAVVESQGGSEESRPSALLSGLNSPHGILVDLASGKMVAEHNSQQRVYPASLTKMMTALLVIENSPDLDEEVELPRDIFHTLFAEDAVIAGFEPGEIAKIRDLLYGILLPSGAESALTLANKISGSEAAFVDSMNQKAQQLGMDQTHFVNATGLHDDEHYSTAEDLSILLRYALHNETFRTVFTTSRYSVQPTNRHPNGFTFWSTMFMDMESAEVPGGEILGGKTGYTEEAGQCLASLARINDREYILVTAGATGTPLGEQLHISDAIDVYSQISGWDRVR